MTEYGDDNDKRDTFPRKLSFIDPATDDHMAAGAQIIIDYHPSSLNPAESINSDNAKPIIFSIRKIYKNVFILSLSLVLMSTAYSGILTLQSSLNAKHNVGVNSLIIVYACTAFSAVFLTNSFLDIFGLKWSIIFAIFANTLYMLANIRPLPQFMYISAILAGLAAAPLWTAQALYINRIGQYHAQHKCQLAEISVSLFFGLFAALQGTSLIWGNLISYFVLNQSNYPQNMNCGIYFDPKSAGSTNQTENVNETTRYVLCGIFAGMTILSMIILFLILDQIRLTKKQTIGESMKKSIEVLVSLIRCKHPDQILLIPITMWALLENAFLLAQFTRAFITCLIGIRYIGLVMISHGICYVISSYIFGWLVRHIGRIGCFISAAVLDYSMMILMYFWEPNDKQIIVLFVIAGVWGIGDAVWQSQVVATYTVLYSDSDPTAVAKNRLWKSVGSLLTYSYASYITIRVTIFFLSAFLTVSMICYGFIEMHLRWKNRRKQQCSVIE